MPKVTKKETKEINVPVLKDVIVPGKDLPDSAALPTGLSQVQLNVLEQQLGEIIEKRLQVVLNKASQDVVKDLKVYLDKRLPEFIKAVQKNQK